MPRNKDYRKRPDWYSAYQKQWAAANSEYKARQNARAKLLHRTNRELAIALYGGACNCCDEARYEFLAIDHINGGGTKERKERFPNSQSFYKYISKNYLPEVYRILCHNCNSALGYYGFCPHQREKECT